MASLRWNRLFPACFLFRVPARPGDPPAVPTATWKPVRDAESRTQHQPGPPEPESASSPDARVRWRQGTFSGATVALLGEAGVSFQLLGAWLGRQVRPPEPDGQEAGAHISHKLGLTRKPRQGRKERTGETERLRCGFDADGRPGGRRMLRAQEVRVRNRETPQACPSGPFGAFVSRGDNLLSSGLGGLSRWRFEPWFRAEGRGGQRPFPQTPQLKTLGPPEFQFLGIPVRRTGREWKHSFGELQPDTGGNEKNSGSSPVFFFSSFKCIFYFYVFILK